MFRIARRTLLCLVVGVTAFGVSGWLLLPRASWSTPLPKEGGDYLFVDPLVDGVEGSIWLMTRRADDENLLEAMAFHPDDGHVGCVVRVPQGFASFGCGRRNDDRLLAQFVKKDAANGGSGTCFQIFAPDKQEPLVSRVLKGRWKVTDDGERAWSIQELPQGFKLVVVDIASGGSISELNFAGGYGKLQEDSIELSSDGRRLAICEHLKSPAPKEAGLEIWGVGSGETKRRIGPPKNLTPQEGYIVKFPEFAERGREIAFYTSWGNNNPLVSHVFVDLETNEYFESRQPPDPDGRTDVAVGSHQLESGETCWEAREKDRRFALYRGRRQLTAWIVPPFRFRPDGFIDRRSRDDQAVTTEGRELVVSVIEPPLLDSLPEIVHDFVPKSWKADDETERHRWWDLHRNVWRNIGCSAVGATQTRSDAFLALTRNETDDGYVLQSWPLPPRDPKWTATAIGVIAFAGVWWLCAKQFKRKASGTSPGVDSERPRPA